MMYKLILLCCALVLGAPAFSQTTETSKPEVFMYVEQMPDPGYDLSKYLGSHIHYPNDARDAGIEGKVVVKFVVNEDGTISNAEVVRGLHKSCDAEALRVIRTMPKWKPGKQNGRAVKVYFMQPISFKLQTGEPATPPSDKK